MDVPDRRPRRADLGPVASEYVRAVGWRSLNLHAHISLVNKYVYVEVPKAGCGTMKATLGGLEAARMGPAMVGRVRENPHDRMKATPFVKPFQLTSAMLEDVLTSADFSRFTVVREPASRLLSGYLEKIGQGLKQSRGIVEALKSSTGADIAPEDITFEQFIDVVVAQASRDQDPHWRRQVDHLALGIVDYDAVIHLEDLDASWTRVGKLTGIADVQEQFYCRNSTGAGARMSEYYTPELLAKVADAYQHDYALLGYALPV